MAATSSEFTAVSLGRMCRCSPEGLGCGYRRMVIDAGLKKTTTRDIYSFLSGPMFDVPSLGGLPLTHTQTELVTSFIISKQALSFPFKAKYVILYSSVCCFG